MFVKRAWYVAGRSSEVVDKPLYRELLGEHVALFRDAKGEARAVSALCPHRGANLGLGKVVNGVLQCPFHGWQFSGEGRCVRVPSQAASVPISEKAHIPSYPLREQDGLLHIWMDRESAPTCEPSHYDFFEPHMARGRQIYDAMVYDASFLNTVENALDGAHLAFVHTGSIGPNQDPLDPEIKLSLYRDGRGFSGTTAVAPVVKDYKRPSGVRGLMSMLTGSARPTVTTFRFDLGGLVVSDGMKANGGRDVVLAFITPMNASKSWFFAETNRAMGLNPVGDIVQSIFAKMLLREDEHVLARLLPVARGPGGLPHPVFVPADKQTLAFRKVYGDALRAEGHKVPWAQGALEKDYMADGSDRIAAE